MRDMILSVAVAVAWKWAWTWTWTWVWLVLRTKLTVLFKRLGGGWALCRVSVWEDGAGLIHVLRACVCM
jgi:hypothetical protein